MSSAGERNMAKVGVMRTHRPLRAHTVAAVSNPSAQRRVLVSLLALLLALSTFASCLTVAGFHDHDCTGDDCAVCHVLQLARTMLRTSTQASAAFSSVATLTVSLLVLIACWQLSLSAETLVSLKVKMQN